MKEFEERLKEQLAPYREQLISHPLYQGIHTTQDLRVFMEHHVFAVWDFMSLLKALQQKLTCVDLPWRPVGSPGVRRMINEIVTGEESDVDLLGNPASHFELYHEAMRGAGADTNTIDKMILGASRGMSWQKALELAAPPVSVQRFIQFTFRLIDSGETHKIAAAFTFGREDLIPDMFTAIVEDLEKRSDNNLGPMIYYLKRHIELDGDEHGPLAWQMMRELCGNDINKWNEAAEVAKESLQHRIALWNGILQAMPINKA